MAHVGSEIRLLSVDGQTFLGLARGPKEADILISNLHSVILYELDSRKPLSSWNTSSADDQVLTTPCCYDPCNSCFVAGFQNNVIRTWTAEDDRIDSGLKNKAHDPITSIIPFQNGSSDAVLVSENGNVAFLRDPDSIFEPRLSNYSSIKHPWAYRNESSIFVGYLSIHEKEIRFHHITFDSTCVQKDYNTICIERSGLALKDAHICNTDQDSVQLTLLWSDGSLSSGKLNTTKTEITWKHLAPLKEINCENDVAITVLNNDVIIVFLNDNDEANCVFFNTKYEAVTMKRMLNTSSSVSKPHVYNIAGQILIILGNDLLLLPNLYENSGLSSLLGVRIQEHSEEASGLEKALLWSTTGLEEKQNDSGNSHKRTGKFSRNFLKLVRDYENQGKSEQCSCPGIIQKILEEKNFEMFSEALEYFQNISEALLTDALIFYLKSEIDCENLILESADQSDINFKQKVAIVNQILSIPINDIFLLDHLRKLPLQETMWLLCYLRNLLMKQGSMNVSSKPDVSQIVDWMNMLLDAHFNQLLLIKDDGLYTLLHDLSTLVAAQVKCLEDQSLLQNSISSLLSKGKLYVSQTKLTYGIEMLIF